MFKALRKRLFSLNGDERGFTIVELLVVITIVGVLAGVGVSGYQRFQARAYETAADAAWRDLQVAISLYEADEGVDSFPRWGIDANGQATPPEAGDKLPDAVAKQLLPPPEPLRRDLWDQPDDSETGFVAGKLASGDNFTCVWVNGVGSRFNVKGVCEIDPGDIDLDDDN